MENHNTQRNETQSENCFFSAASVEFNSGNSFICASAPKISRTVPNTIGIVDINPIQCSTWVQSRLNIDSLSSAFSQTQQAHFYPHKSDNFLSNLISLSTKIRFSFSVISQTLRSKVNRQRVNSSDVDVILLLHREGFSLTRAPKQFIFLRQFARCVCSA